MDVLDHAAETSAEAEEAAPCVSALAASPDRTVFTEEGNCDGWIATDLIVNLHR